MSLSKISEDYSPGAEADDEIFLVDNDFQCGGEDSSSEDWGNPKPKVTTSGNPGYNNVRVQELKKEEDYSSVEVKPQNYFDYSGPKVIQTNETEGKLFTDAVLFVTSSEESESLVNKNAHPAQNFNYYGGPDGDQGSDPWTIVDNSII